MKQIKLLPSLREFFESRRVNASTEPIISFQQPALDGQEGPRPDGPTGWRLCRDGIEQSSGGGTVFPVDLDDNESKGRALGVAVAAASEMGAQIIRLECELVDETEEEAIRKMLDRCPQVTAFRASGGKVMMGPDEMKPMPPDDQE